MSRLYRPISAFLLAVAALATVGCASTPTTEGTGEFFDDSVITTKVKAAILHEESLKVTEIGVATFKGDVTLSGTVENADKARVAVRIAQGVAGVKSVKNEIKVK